MCVIQDGLVSTVTWNALSMVKLSTICATVSLVGEGKSVMCQVVLGMVKIVQGTVTVTLENIHALATVDGQVMLTNLGMLTHTRMDVMCPTAQVNQIAILKVRVTAVC